MAVNVLINGTPYVAECLATISIFDCKKIRNIRKKSIKISYNLRAKLRFNA